LHEDILPIKKQYKKSTHYEVLSMAMSPYSMFINDIIIRAVNVHGKNQKICGQITAKKPRQIRGEFAVVIIAIQ